MSPKRQFVPAHTKTRRLRLAALIVVAGLVFGVPLLRNGLRHGVAFVGTGIGHGAHAVGGFFGSIGTGFRSKNALSKENAALRSEIESLRARVASVDSIVRENTELKAAMGRTGEARFTLSAVLGKPPHSVYDTLLIDGGAGAGLAKGQTVYANGATPIGTVAEVMAKTAIVRLYSTPGEKTEARLSPSNADITIVGRGGGNYSAQVPHELAVEEGATVVTKELDPAVIGIFMKVTSDARDPFQTLLLASPINVNDLSFVQVRH